MKTSSFKLLFAAILLFAASLASAQTPPINGCFCTNSCGPSPNGGYEFANLTGCNITIKYIFFDGAGNIGVSGSMSVPAGGFVCLVSCADFTAFSTTPWDIIVTLQDINGNPIPIPNTVNHSGTSQLLSQPSPDPCTPTWNMVNGPCGVTLY